MQYVAGFADPKSISVLLERYLRISEVDDGLEERFEVLDVGGESYLGKDL